MSEEKRPSQTRDEYPYIAYKDRPACPSCERQEEVVSGGQWRDGDCVWWSCCCGIEWTTQRPKASSS